MLIYRLSLPIRLSLLSSFFSSLVLYSCCRFKNKFLFFLFCLMMRFWGILTTSVHYRSLLLKGLKLSCLVAFSNPIFSCRSFPFARVMFSPNLSRNLSVLRIPYAAVSLSFSFCEYMTSYLPIAFSLHSIFPRYDNHLFSKPLSSLSILKSSRAAASLMPSSPKRSGIIPHHRLLCFFCLFPSRYHYISQLPPRDRKRRNNERENDFWQTEVRHFEPHFAVMAIVDIRADLARSFTSPSLHLHTHTPNIAQPSLNMKNDEPSRMENPRSSEPRSKK